MPRRVGRDRGVGGARKRACYTRADVRPAHPPLRARCPSRSTRGIRATGCRPRLAPADGLRAARHGRRACRQLGGPGWRGRMSSTSAWRRTRTPSPRMTDTLLSLGFRPQAGLAPFPPTRPMLPGMSTTTARRPRPLHVMPPARHELAELVAFRDALRADPELRDEYARPSSGSWRPPPTATRTCCTRSTRPTSSRPRCTGSGSAGSGRCPRAARAGRHRGPWGRAAGPDAGDRGARDGLPAGRPRPRPGLPGRAGRRRIVVARYDDAEAARAWRDGRRRDLRAGARGTRRRGRGRGADAAPGLARSSDPRPARRAPVHPRDRRVGRALARGPWIDDAPAAAEALGYPFGSRRRSADTTAGARPGSGRGRGRGRGDVARRRPPRPLLLEREIDYEAEQQRAAVVAAEEPRRGASRGS